MITKEKILETDLSQFYYLDNIDHSEFYGDPGKEHYRLLAYLSTQFSGKTLIDIGSHRGSSAAALSFNPQNQVESFDIENRIPESQNSPKNIKNIRFNYVNLFNLESRSPWEKTILESPLIFLDIDPHDGILEYEFYLWLKSKKYNGAIIFDDIHYFIGMRKNLWQKIEDSEKEDITHLGHWSGTGIIQFSNKFIFS